MPDDPAEEVARLRDGVDQATQRFENAGALIGPVTASDDSGMITVALDKDGVLQEVRVNSLWRRSLDVSALGGAVHEALLKAAAQRTEVWWTNFAEQSRDPDPQVRPMPGSDETLAGQLAAFTTTPLEGAPTAALEELLLMVRAVNEGIDEASSEIGRHLAAEYVGRSTSGHVHATVSGAGEIRELRYDQRWIQKAHHFNIGRESTEAIRDAHQKMANHSVQGIIDASPLGEVLALAKDPKALAERLRLRE